LYTTPVQNYSSKPCQHTGFCASPLRIFIMNPNTNSNRFPKSGLQVDRITRIITEQWPEIWQASIDKIES
jgi:hypothetical protein